MSLTNFEEKEVWYLSSPSPYAGSELRITRIGHTTAGPGYVRGPRVQSEYSLHFVLQGKLQLTYSDTTAELQAGDMFLLTKEQRYTYAMLPDQLPLQKMWIALQGTQIDWLRRQLELTDDKPYVRRVVQLQARTVLQSILHTMREQSDPEPLLLLSMFYQLLAACRPEKGLPNSAHSSYDWLQRARYFMDIHYMETITLDDVCKHVSVSRGHFSEVFLLKFGISPSHYLKQLRMERARTLVEQTSFTITEIAFSVGYDSLYSFSRAYRNYYGVSPNTARGRVP